MAVATKLVPGVSDLNFSKANTGYATHWLHPFAAKCPPQLASWAISNYSRPGHLVLDPMAGGGTTLVEARRAGRSWLAAEIDPLARLIAQVKATPLDTEEVARAIAIWVDRLERPGELQMARMPRDLLNFDRWFDIGVARRLGRLKTLLTTTRVAKPIRDFGWVALSSLIVARTSVANARDLVHSRAHFQAHDEPPDVYGRFAERLQRMSLAVQEFTESLDGQIHGEGRFIGSDARSLAIEDDVVDLIFTSPPYVNALDYTRAHIFSVAWLSEQLGISVDAYRRLGRSYIGSDRGTRTLDAGEHAADVPLVDQLVQALQSESPDHARMLKRYFADMWKVLAECARVLKPDGRCILVVCPSHLRKVSVPTHEVFICIGEALRDRYPFYLTLELVRTRVIDDARRLLPYLQPAFGQRMREEYVLVLRKQATR